MLRKQLSVIKSLMLAFVLFITAIPGAQAYSVSGGMDSLSFQLIPDIPGSEFYMETTFAYMQATVHVHSKNNNNGIVYGKDATESFHAIADFNLAENNGTCSVNAGMNENTMFFIADLENHSNNFLQADGDLLFYRHFRAHGNGRILISAHHYADLGQSLPKDFAYSAKHSLGLNTSSAYHHITVHSDHDLSSILELVFKDGESGIFNANLNFRVSNQYGTSTVPIPAAFWLLGSGLLGLGSTRFRLNHKIKKWIIHLSVFGLTIFSVIPGARAYSVSTSLDTINFKFIPDVPGEEFYIENLNSYLSYGKVEANTLFFKDRHSIYRKDAIGLALNYNLSAKTSGAAISLNVSESMENSIAFTAEVDENTPEAENMVNGDLYYTRNFIVHGNGRVMLYGNYHVDLEADVPKGVRYYSFMGVELMNDHNSGDRDYNSFDKLSDDLDYDYSVSCLFKDGYRGSYEFSQRFFLEERTPGAVPIPSALLLFGSGLIGLRARIFRKSMR